MAVADYLVQYQLPVDILTLYSAASNYALGGMYISVQLPPDFPCVACRAPGESNSLLKTLTSTPTSVSSFTLSNVTNPDVTSISSSIVVRLFLNGYLSI